VREQRNDSSFSRSPDGRIVTKAGAFAIQNLASSAAKLLGNHRSEIANRASPHSLRLPSNGSHTETLLVGVPVLRNDGGNALRMTDGESEACWCTVVKDVYRKLTEAYDLGEAHVGNVVERVSEVFLAVACRIDRSQEGTAQS